MGFMHKSWESPRLTASTLWKQCNCSARSSSMKPAVLLVFPDIKLCGLAPRFAHSKNMLLHRFTLWLYGVYWAVSAGKLRPFLRLSVQALYATLWLTRESFLWRKASTCGQILLVSVPVKVCSTPLLLKSNEKTDFLVCFSFWTLNLVLHDNDKKHKQQHYLLISFHEGDITILHQIKTSIYFALFEMGTPPSQSVLSCTSNDEQSQNTVV